MLAAGFVDLFVRMVTSLALVLAIVAIAYVVMRRRAGFTTGTTSGGAGRGRGGARASATRPGATRNASRSNRAGRRANRQAIEVLGRVGLSRSSAAVALRFGDRVILVGASEQSQPTVLAEIDAATWELADAAAEWTVPAVLATDVDGADTNGQSVAARPGFLDALREATVRRA
jgi:flagellar biogenesis protein FliO